ncbi:zinc finger MYM-type protein 1-like [Aphis craccivora]|uniref:Zinc finger MYM-type protein 1-like n=1 Tax=Aphis craccivora TaxID=307492 RepID=A0A6G0VKN6_APHCR|nr:zinc finger MYM-type protein 1-like [Aphis craccivora]
MTEERLSSLATTSIEKDLINTLSKNDEKFNEKIIDKFALLKERKIDLIFKT